MGSREQETSKGLKEKGVTLRAHRVKKSLDYSKVENPLYVVQSHNEDKDDGLVKHMRNLPGYLQRAEKGDNIQGKALNFGVLDWGRLENWKSNEKRIPPTLVDSGSARFSRNRKKIHPPRRDHQQASNGNPSCVERPPPGVRWPRGKAVKVQVSERSPARIPDLPSGSKGKQAEQTRALPSCDVNSIESNERRLSNCFSPDRFLPISPFSDVPHSCPFPLGTGSNPEPECTYETPITPARGRSLEETVQHLTSGEALKGNQSPPNRRFSFSLGKMTRSLSFKESSSLPQLSSTYTAVKSGPVNFKASPDSNYYNRKNGNTTNGSRSSPLRRLLDPLLKLKGAHLAEKVPKPKTNLSSETENELLYGKNHRSSNVQALLQLTLKNGIPFFKLVVESSSDILAAAVKKLPSGKDDSSLTYAFYSVHETKKKSGGWIYQNSKEKSYQFGYTIIGQMKISSSYHAEFSGPEKDLYVVRESVLYGTDIISAGQKTLDCRLDQELAAIIVKNPSDETAGDIGSSKSTVVILPDGVHSLPNFGQPSPLIKRWRSGGACDCGGWDIGCRFCVISHQNESVNAPSRSNRLDLSYEGGRENKCGFSLVALQEGLYSLEYEPSISLLQAFSICVAVVSSQKLTHIFQVNYVPESKDLSKPITMVKSRDEFPAKYVSKPPASPVGRV